MPVQKATQSLGTKKGPCTGKKFLVTGGSRGLGKAIVAELHEQGAFVYALGKNPDNLNVLKNEFPAVVTIEADITDWDGTRKALQGLEPIDCLINNAAIAPSGSLLETTKDILDSAYKTNLRSVVNLSQIVAKTMIENGSSGSIVNVSSITGRVPFASALAYSTTKGALEMMTKIMAIELGPHKITVNSVCPALMETDMYFDAALARNDDEAVAKYFEMKTPTKARFMPLTEVVSTILFFGSNTCPQITGESLLVDGGMSLTF